MSGRHYVRSIAGFHIRFADGRAHRLSAAEVTLHKGTVNGDLAHLKTNTAGVGTWVIKGSDRCVIADIVTYLGLPPKSDEPAPSVLPALPKVVVDVLDMDLDARIDCDLSDIPPSVIIDVCTSLRGDF